MNSTSVQPLHYGLIIEDNGENYETEEDDEAGDNEIGECAWVLGELDLKPVLCYQGTLASLRLPRTGFSLRLARYYFAWIQKMTEI